MAMQVTDLISDQEKQRRHRYPIHYLSQSDLNYPCIETLVKNCFFDINERDYNDETPLHIAARHSQNLLCVNYTQKLSADVNARNSLGETPLFLAAERDNYTLCNYFLKECKSDVNIGDNLDNYPIHLAARNKNKDLIRLLLEAKADVHKKNDEGKTAACLAKENGLKDEFIELLKEEIVSLTEIEDLQDGYSIPYQSENGLRTLKRNFQFPPIGQGTFGVVSELILPSGHSVAVKEIKNMISLTNNSNENTLAFQQTDFQEVQALMHVSHPNIVKFLHSCVDSEGGQFQIYIFMEFVPNGNLYHKIRAGLNSEQIISYTKQLFECLCYLKSQKVFHRDIKPNNILVTNHDIIKLCDFGLAKLLETLKSETNSAKGTIKYMAPEVFNKGHSNHKSDVWSSGLVLYEMLTKTSPAVGENLKQRKQKLTEMQIHQDFIDVVALCLQKDTKKRAEPEVILRSRLFASKSTSTFHQDSITSLSSLSNESRSKVNSLRSNGGSDSELARILNDPDLVKEEQILWIIYEVSKKRRNERELIQPSEVYHTNTNGYSFQLLCYLNGSKSEEGKNISLGLQIVKSENDNDLTWPCEIKFLMEIVKISQYKEMSPAMQEICHNCASDSRKRCFEKPQDQVSSAYARPNLLSQKEAYSSDYLCDDALIIRVSFEDSKPDVVISEISKFVKVKKENVKDVNQKLWFLKYAKCQLDNSNVKIIESPFYYTNMKYYYRVVIQKSDDGFMYFGIQLAKGLHDDFISWPCPQTFTIELVKLCWFSSASSESSKSVSLALCTDQHRKCFEQPTGEVNSVCRRKLRMSTAEVCGPLYMKDGSIIVRVSV